MRAWKSLSKALVSLDSKCLTGEISFLTTAPYTNASMQIRFLKQAFVTGSRKGSGVFGDELGQGNILHVEHIRVEDAWQRKGVGKAMVRKLI